MSSSSALDQVATLRQQGNDAFTKGEANIALARYTEALAALEVVGEPWRGQHPRRRIGRWGCWREQEEGDTHEERVMLQSRFVFGILK